MRFGGFKKAARKFSKLSDQFQEAANKFTGTVDKGAEETAKDIANTASRLAPVRTGRLRNSIDYQQLGEGEWVVGTPLHYAEIVERGRGPVTPTEADALKFEINGQTVYAKRVGPAEPQPFMRPALIQHRDDFSGNIEEEIEIMFEDVFD